MLLIETKKNGTTIRTHWNAPCETMRQAARNVRFMKRCWGSDYQHSVREIKPEEMALVLQPKQSTISIQKSDIEAWHAECLRIGELL